MGKHEKENLKEWWADVRWEAKHGKYDWALPLVIGVVGVVLWRLMS